MPLQIGARDVAFPRLNAISFWLFFMGAMLFNISFVIGGSPDAGWSSYFPLAGNEFSPHVGTNYYMIGIQIAGIGTLMTGINFMTTILKMRAPGMTLMKMPMFTWSALVTSIIIIFAFPVLTVALIMGTMDRLFATKFFTMTDGGMDMLWANLFWVWGHPEVYILIFLHLVFLVRLSQLFHDVTYMATINGCFNGFNLYIFILRLDASFLYNGSNSIC